MFNAHRIRPTPTGMIRLVDYLLYIGDEVEARRAVLLIAQLFSEEEREIEYHWPSNYVAKEFYDGRKNTEKFDIRYPTKGAVYVNGLCRGEMGVLTTRSLAARFEKQGYSL